MIWPSWASLLVGLWWPYWWLCSTDGRIRRFASYAGAAIATACAVLSTGCESLPPIAPPGEPRMVLEATGSVRLAAFDEATGDFVELGWHDAAGLRGWTIAAYDWRSEP